MFDENKRKILGVTIASAAIWSKPIVTSIVLPAHAQTTPEDIPPKTTVPPGTPPTTPPPTTPPPTTPPPTIDGCSDEWDKSSYVFSTNCSANTVTLCNTGDKRATCPIKFEVYYTPVGNPKRGALIYSGEIPAIGLGCGTIDISQYYNSSGNYMVKAFQHSGHPGTGILWSEACEFSLTF